MSSATKRRLDDDSSGENKRVTCAFVVPKKNHRKCHFPARPGEKFCAQHILGINESTNKDKNSIKLTRKRIPCPKDPSHTIWEDNVAKHVKKCWTNSTDHARGEVYFKQDVNIEEHIDGGEGKTGVDSINISKDGSDDPDPISSATPESISEAQCIELVQAIYQSIPSDLVQRKIHTHRALEIRLQEVGNKKHAVQQASLIGIMEEHGVLRPEDSVIAEFGCGRAELSHYVAKARLETVFEHRIRSKYLLIDRSGVKNKQDIRIIKDYKEHVKYEAPKDGDDRVKDACMPVVQRIRIDIKDLQLQKCDILAHPTTKLHVISKHLCGCATDLTLHCVRNSGLMDSDRVGAIVIALCCRQLCSYDTYSALGKKWLAKYGIFRAHFDMIRKMTSWAVCGQRPGMDLEAYKAKERIGLLCRRIIDYGRVLTLESWGFDVRLVEYIGKEVSLENCCLIAVRKET